MRSVLKCRLQLNLTEIVLKYKISPYERSPIHVRHSHHHPHGGGIRRPSPSGHIRTLWKDSRHLEYEVPTVLEFKNRIASTLKRYPYLAAIRDGHILGYAYASAFKERAAYDWAVETSIYVSEGARRTGAGSLYTRHWKII